MSAFFHNFNLLELGTHLNKSYSYFGAKSNDFKHC